MVRAVFTDHIFQHLAPPAVTEVRINIGHADALRIQEPFKEQVKIQRVNVCDVQQISHDGTGCAAPARAHRNGIRAAVFIFVAAAVVDKIPHDQEIRRIAHLLNDAQLVFQALLYLFFFFPSCSPCQFLQQNTVTFRDFRLAEAAHVGVRIIVELRRNGKLRQQQLAKGQVHVAALRNLVSIMQGFFVFREQRPHFLITLAVIPVVVETHAVRIVHILIGLDTEQHVLG